MRITVRIADVLYPFRDRYSSSCCIRPHNDYTGIIIPRLSWLSDEWFCLKEDNGDIRILFKDNIICGWRLPDVCDNAAEPKYAEIIRGNKRYTVSLSNDGRSFSCSCTGFSYRRRCSHVEEVLNAA